MENLEKNGRWEMWCDDIVFLSVIIKTFLFPETISILLNSS